MKIKTYQKSANAIHYTYDKLFCSVCNKQTKEAIQTYDGKVLRLGCFGFDINKNCFKEVIEISFANLDIEKDYINIRLIRSKAKFHKREPVGLAKRYQVFKRDGFKCVCCGNNSKDSRLEIDHVVPVSKGGGSQIKNLQTLCFRCNRGKRND